MNTQLFNRRWKITFAPTGSNVGQTYDSLRVVFDIDKRAEGNANKAKFDVYNLNSQSRANYRAGYRVIFQAGYGTTPEDTILHTLYDGDIPSGPKGAITKRHGQDIFTTFDCGEFARNLANVFVNKTFPRGTPVTDLLKFLASVEALNVPLGNVQGLNYRVYNSGYIMAGPASKYLDDICRSQNLIWTIQSGALQIYPIGRSYQSQAIVLSSGSGVVPTPIAPGSTLRALASTNTGLIGIPSIGDKFCVFEALLNPNIQPGCLVQIISEQVFGFFTVTRAHFTGDSHGDRWQVACEAVQTTALALPQQSLGGNISIGNVA